MISSIWQGYFTKNNAQIAGSPAASQHYTVQTDNLKICESV